MSRIQINFVLLRLEFFENLFTYGNHNKAGWMERVEICLHIQKFNAQGGGKIVRERETLFECTLLRL